MGRILLLACLVLALIYCGKSQDIPDGAFAIGNNDICTNSVFEGGASPSDNLFCPTDPGLPELRCYSRSELCNGMDFCISGSSDEGGNINALECEAVRSDSFFQCTSGVNVNLDQLCDGFDNCNGGGDDETTPLCANKCRLPYYGSCPYTRECETSDLDVICRGCLPGFVEDPQNPNLDCLPIINIDLQFTAYNVDEPDNTVTVCAEITGGTVDAGDSVIATLSTSPQTATAADFGVLNPPAVFTFTSSQSVDCTQITIDNDNVVEATEFFSVSLDSTNPQVVIGISTASVFIADDDEALFEFTQNTYIGLENVASPPDIPFAIRLASTSDILGQPVTVTVTSISGAGSATANVDYSPVVVQFNFPAGSGPLTPPMGDALDPIDDSLVEGNENVQLSAVISPTINAAFTLNGDSATVVIQDDDDLVIGFNPVTYQVSEIQGQVEVCFTVRENQLAIPAQAILNTQIGSATSPADFTALVNVQVSLPVGTNLNTAPFCTPITIENDGVPENLETFSVLLSSGSSGIVVVDPTDASATVNIIGDRTIFEIEQNNYNVNEGDGSVEVCAVLVSGLLSANTPIQFTPAIGSAGASDFTVSSQTQVFPAGSSAGERRCINIPINDDVLVELLESFSVSLSSTDPNVEFSPGGTQATVTITDNDVARFGFTQATYVQSESSSPAQPAIQLLFGELTFPIDVDVSTVAGGSATAGLDYSSVISQRLTFPTGSAPNDQMPFDVTIFSDTLVEGDETVNLMANSPSNFADVDPDSATLVIVDDDTLLLALQEDTYSVFEFGGSLDVCFEVLNGILDIDVQPAANLFTQPGSALDPLDYTGINVDNDLLAGTGLPGQTVFCRSISINDDNIAEGPEDFLVILSSLNSQFVTIDPSGSSATVTILDDDDIVFEFEELIYDTTEGGFGMVMVCVNLVSGILSRSVQVEVVPKPTDPLLDSATPVDDYSLFTSPLVFPNGATPMGANGRQCFNIQPFISDDVLVEALESFRIGLQTSDASAVFTPGRDCATTNIQDNDQVTIILVPPPGAGLPNYIIPEDGGSQEVCVMIQGGAANILQRPVTVSLDSSDGPAVGGAQAPADYGAISSAITFFPGQEGQQICRDIPIFDDIICEGEELFNVGLSTTDPGVNLNPVTSSGTVTIIDNDVATISADQIIYTVNEQGDLWINLHLDGQKGPGRECVVSVMTVDGTATDGEDYVGVAGDYVFNNTVFTQLVHLDIIQDNRCEGDENFEVFLSTSSPACLIGTPQLSVTIIDDEIGGTGDDPHFSIYLPSGEMLCYTVQGEQGFAFNLINNKQLVMNAKFVPDARREEVTWLGSMGIIIRNSNYGGLNDTKLRFEAQEKTVYINDKVVLSAKNVEKLTFSNGKMSISEVEPTAGFHYPSLLINLEDVEVSFTIKYTNQHLDMFWHSTGKKVVNSHGLIGQFFRNGVEIDKVRKILIMPDKEPVPVMRRPVWSFMERETVDDQLCWTAMNSGYQGEGLIDGTYFDYLVDDVMSTDFKFKQ